MIQKSRVARFSRVAKKVTGGPITNSLLITAPGAGKRIVIDWLYVNISVAGTVEVYNNATAWSDADGLLGGTFAASGGAVASTHTMEGGDNQAVSYTTTGAAQNSYVVVVYHIEDAPSV